MTLGVVYDDGIYCLMTTAWTELQIIRLRNFGGPQGRRDTDIVERLASL